MIRDQKYTVNVFIPATSKVKVSTVLCMRSRNLKNSLSGNSSGEILAHRCYCISL